MAEYRSWKEEKAAAAAKKAAEKPRSSVDEPAAVAPVASGVTPAPKPGSESCAKCIKFSKRPGTEHYGQCHDEKGNLEVEAWKGCSRFERR